MRWLVALLLWCGAAHAQTVIVGPLQAQNNLSEIAAAGSAAQAAARMNLGISSGGAYLPLIGGTVTGLTTFTGTGTGLAVTNNATIGGTLNLTSVQSAPSILANFGAQTYSTSGSQPSTLTMATGSTGTLPASGQYCSFCFSNTNDTTNTGSNTNGFVGLNMTYLGGGAWAGGHAAAQITAKINSIVADAGANSFLGGLNVYAAGNAAITSGVLNIIALAPTTTISSGSTGYALVEAIEGGVFASAPLSAGRFGTVMNSGGTAQGAANQGDAAFTAGGKVGSVGWKTIYGIGKASNAWGLDPTGTVIGPLIQLNGGSVTTIAQDALYGADFGSINFSGAAFRSPGFSVDPAGCAYSGDGSLCTTGTSVALDTSGYTGSSPSMSNAGASYTANDRLYDTTYDGIFVVDTVNGSGNIQTFHWLTNAPPHCFGGSCPATLALIGGTGNQAAVANMTWTQGTALALGASAATAIGIGNSGSTTTIAGTVIAPNVAAGTVAANSYIGLNASGNMVLGPGGGGSSPCSAFGTTTGTCLQGAGALGTPSSATLTNATGLPISTGVTGLGAGVASALSVNVGSAGAPVLFNGAAGTPTSMTGTNITGTASGLTAGAASAVSVGGITGLGTGVGTALGVAVGTAGAPVVNGGALGTPSGGVATNLTGTAAGLTAGTATTANSINSATTTVVVNAATAPSGGQVLTATSSTAANWATPTAAPTAASPTATIGTSAVNGSATTYMRSDGAPAAPQASATTFGLMKPDGTTQTAAAGVISTVATTINGTSCTPGSSCSLATAQAYSCAVPLTTGVGSTTLTCFMKAARAFTVDNITATVAGTLVTVTPTLFECGTSTTCTSPTTIGSGAVTASNTATPITVSSATITSGDYIAVELTAGTITSVAVNVQVEMH